MAAGFEPRPLPRPMPLEAPQLDGLTMPLPQRVLLFVLVRPLPIDKLLESAAGTAAASQVEGIKGREQVAQRVVIE